jgi:hypothetical protein
LPRDPAGERRTTSGRPASTSSVEGGTIDRFVGSCRCGEALAELTRASFRSIATNPQAVGLIQNSGDIKAELEGIWIEVVNRGIRHRVLQGELHATLVRRFIRDSIAAAVRWWRPDGVLTIDEVAESYIDLIYNGLLIVPQPHVRPPSAPAAKAQRRWS